MSARRDKLAAFGGGAFLMLLTLWLSGYVYFLNNALAKPAHPGVFSSASVKADAIIVLTGGQGRIENGIRLLEEQAADMLFISGVHQGVTLEALLKLWDRTVDDLPCCIVLGYKAQNTRENAEEAREWIKKNNINAIHLVTTDYHMRRAQLEFNRALPNLTVYPRPVASPRLRLRTLFGEYNKMLVRWFQLKNGA